MKRQESLLMEYEKECANTRKLLAAVPMDRLGWKPHEKSMSLEQLAVHIADIPNWMAITIEKEVLDFAKEEYKPKKVATQDDLLKIHDDAVAAALKCLSEASDEKLLENWTMRNGEQIYFTMPKVAVLRMFVYNHLYHHRGQLTVYLRLLDVPVPGMYGPTADDAGM
ncbi:MAG: DinB family protein [Chitinophagales bacterium]